MTKKFKWRKAKAVKNQPAADQKEAESAEESCNAHGYVENGIEIDLVQDLKKKYQTATDDQTAHNKKQLFWTKIAAGLVFVYALLTGWQGCLTRQAIDNSTKQFQIDQRPYVWTTNMRFFLKIEAGQPMCANIPMANYGKSPALKTKTIGKIFIGPTAKVDADIWFDTRNEKSFDVPGISETVVLPGTPSLIPPDTKEIPTGGLGGWFFTLTGDKVLTQADVDYILNTDESAVIVVQFEYFDAFGNRYWSDLCTSRFVNGNTPNCHNHNEIH